MLKRAIAIGLFLAGNLWGQQQTTREASAPLTAQNHPVDVRESMPRSGGSLLRATLGTPTEPGQAKLAQVSFFSVPEPTPKTLKKHDLVTIIVREQSDSKTDAKTETKKQATVDLTLQNWIRLNTQAKSLSAVTVPPINADLSREFKGDGKESRTDSFTMRVTVEVLDVKPNGTVMLQGRKHVMEDEKDLLFLLSGTCRAEDIMPDNTVLSTQMGDFDMQKITKGAASDATKRGFIPKLLDAINPF